MLNVGGIALLGGMMLVGMWYGIVDVAMWGYYFGWDDCDRQSKLTQTSFCKSFLWLVVIVVKIF